MAKHQLLLLTVLFVAGITMVAQSEKATAVAQSQQPEVVTPAAEADMELIQARLAKAFNAQPDSIVAAPLPGYVEVIYGSEIYYISNNAKHLISGEVYDLLSLENLTEQRRAVDRKKIMAAIPESSMIVYKAKDEKHVLNVFTDIDCVYCRKLHQEIAQINALGITVRYLAYPRAGLGSPSYDKAVSVWCNADRNVAMDKAKASGSIEPMKCDAPVAAHMQLAREMGVNSTPSLILDNGRLQPGYAPAAQLLALFK